MIVKACVTVAMVMLACVTCLCVVVFMNTEYNLFMYYCHDTTLVHVIIQMLGAWDKLERHDPY